MKPFPRDILVHVAPLVGEAIIDPESPTELRRCRDCNTELVIRLSNLAYLERHPDRNGRPIGFLCLSCVVTYTRPPGIIDMRVKEGASSSPT